MQCLALAGRQFFECQEETSLRFRLFELRLGMEIKTLSVSSWYGCHCPQQGFPSFCYGRLANHCEQPRLQFAFAPIKRLALKNLQIDRLQNVLGHCSVMAATTQRPAKTGAMKSFKLRF